MRRLEEVIWMLVQVIEVPISMKAELGRLGTVVLSPEEWKSRCLRLHVSLAIGTE